MITLNQPSTRTRRFLAALALPAAMLLCSCDDRRGAATSPGSSSTPAETKADNTAVNERDQNTSAKTPMDQKENQADITITAEIRKAVMAEKVMSINGQNCKIITMNGDVTLRGPVDSQSEKDLIAAKAKSVAGVRSVTNELEVKVK